MKRFSLGSYNQEEEENVHNVNMAGLLMLLSRSGGGGGGRGGREATNSSSSSSSSSSANRVFECKTCSRQFLSFQALGGHRASHKKPRHAPEGSAGGGGGGGGQGQRIEKPRVHECSVCGLEFSIGQALGGHMRRHRAEAGAADAVGGGKKRVWLDLNLPPMTTTTDPHGGLPLLMSI